MVNHLHELRKKPKHTRDNVAFGIASGMTLVLAMGWFAVKGIGLPEVTPITVEDSESSDAFSTFFTQMKEQMAAASQSFSTSTATASIVAPDIPDGSAFNLATSTDLQLERIRKEAAIMIVSDASSSTATSAPTSNVLY